MSKLQYPVGLVVDSTSSIPESMLKQYDIRIAPLHIIWGMEDFLDGVEITPQQFYARLTKDPIHPKTSQPNADEIAAVFNQAREDGAKAIFMVTISNGLSKTYESACRAVEMVDIPVRIHDSRSAGMGAGWQMIAAARVQEKGGDIEAMVAAAERARQTANVMLTVDTLEYLHKGGRIGTAARFFGTALSVKPQLHINTKVGLIEAGEKTRTRKKALDSVYASFFAVMDPNKPLHIAVCQAAAMPDAEAIAARIREEYSPVELLVTDVTPVIGTHVGPGTVGITGYYED